MTKIIGDPVEINNDFLQVFFELTNGNGYLISKFIESNGQTLLKKLVEFAKNMTPKLIDGAQKFFGSSSKALTNWFQQFPKILTYLDLDKDFPSYLVEYYDKNFAYIQNSKLKSVNNFAKEVFLQYYREQIKENKINIDFLKLLSHDISSQNHVLKGILYEHYIVQKFYEELKSQMIHIQTYELKTSKKIETIACDNNEDSIFSIFLNEEIPEIIKTRKKGCLIKPFKFNHPVFDLVFWDPTKQFLYFLQITINSKHPPVDEYFFKYKEYEFLRNIEGVKETRFIWVTNAIFESKYIDENDRIGYLIIKLIS